MNETSKPETKIRFARKSQPKHWTDDLGKRHTSWGDVVVTCSEHGEVGRFPSASYLEETYPESNNAARLAQERHAREEHTPESIQPDVKVIGAPGYADFEGVLLLQNDGWPVAVVGFEWEGKRDVAVVPTSCVTPLADN